MAKHLCEQYLAALNASDLNAVLALFTDDAWVVSPLYGEMPAAQFYRDLFTDTQASDTRLLNIFDSSSNSNSLALHFHYRWTLQSGELVEFEVVDVFELSENHQQFSKLTIIYDTYFIRQPHTQSQLDN